MLKRNILKRRLFLGSFIGGLSGLIILFDISSFFFFVLKLFLGFLIVIVTFSFRNIKYTMNNFFYLVILSILLGGSLYLLNIEISKTVLMNDYVYIILLLLVGLLVTLIYAKYMRSSKQVIVNRW